MNNRIRELAKQSGLIQYDSDGKMEEVEKFAELIVKETIDDSNEIGDRVTAMQNEIRRLRELCELLQERNQRLNEHIRPKGKSWLAVDAEGNAVMRKL